MKRTNYRIANRKSKILIYLTLINKKRNLNMIIYFFLNVDPDTPVKTSMVAIAGASKLKNKIVSGQSWLPKYGYVLFR